MDRSPEKIKNSNPPTLTTASLVFSSTIPPNTQRNILNSEITSSVIFSTPILPNESMSVLNNQNFFFIESPEFERKNQEQLLMGVATENLEVVEAKPSKNNQKTENKIPKSCFKIFSWGVLATLKGAVDCFKK